jgi:hypothetical protein
MISFGFIEMKKWKLDNIPREIKNGNELRSHHHRDHKSHSSFSSKREFNGNGVKGYYKKHQKKSHDGSS